MAITPYNSKINFQDWPSPHPHPLPTCYHIKFLPPLVGTMRITCKFINSCPEMLIKIVLFKILENFQKNIYVGLLFGVLLIVLHHKYFPGSFLKF